jgi:hypothetical protein
MEEALNTVIQKGKTLNFLHHSDKSVQLLILYYARNFMLNMLLHSSHVVFI